MERPGERSHRCVPAPEEAGERSDVYLLRKLREDYPELTRARLKQLFDEGLVRAEGRPVKSGEKTRAGRALELRLPPFAEAGEDRPEPLPMRLDIRYEDDYLLVLNKPRGLVVHPAPGHAQDTLVNGLLHHYGKEGLSDFQGLVRPGIVHRIDKDTSGLLLVVKDARVHAKLGEALRRHEIRRRYVALVYGHPSADSGTVDMPIGRAPGDRQKMAVRRDGRPAVTHFTVRERLRALSLLDLELETGRTHQIRVHMKQIGHPVVADPLYAPKRERYGLEGQALHAAALDFVHPLSGAAIHVEAPLPDCLEALIAAQRR